MKKQPLSKMIERLGELRPELRDDRDIPNEVYDQIIAITQYLLYMAQAELAEKDAEFSPASEWILSVFLLTKRETNFIKAFKRLVEVCKNNQQSIYRLSCTFFYGASTEEMTTLNNELYKSIIIPVVGEENFRGLWEKLISQKVAHSES